MDDEKRPLTFIEQIVEDDIYNGTVTVLYAHWATSNVITVKYNFCSYLQIIIYNYILVRNFQSISLVSYMPYMVKLF